MGAGTRLGAGRVVSYGSRGQIRRLQPGKSQWLRVESDGKGVGARLGIGGGARQEQGPDCGSRGPARRVPPI